jgi:hypothetical protein
MLVVISLFCTSFCFCRVAVGLFAGVSVFGIYTKYGFPKFTQEYAQTILPNPLCMDLFLAMVLFLMAPNMFSMGPMVLKAVAVFAQPLLQVIFCTVYCCTFFCLFAWLVSWRSLSEKKNYPPSLRFVLYFCTVVCERKTPDGAGIHRADDWYVSIQCTAKSVIKQLMRFIICF